MDRNGSAYVTGFTSSSDYPTTSGAFDRTFNGVSDAFVTKLNASGSALAYSTFLGDGLGWWPWHRGARRQGIRDGGNRLRQLSHHLWCLRSHLQRRHLRRVCDEAQCFGFGSSLLHLPWGIGWRWSDWTILAWA